MQGVLVGGPCLPLVAGDFRLEVVVVGLLGQLSHHLYPGGLGDKEPGACSICRPEMPVGSRRAHLGRRELGEGAADGAVKEGGASWGGSRRPGGADQP